MPNRRTVTSLWLLMVALTLAGGLLGEMAESGAGVVLIVASTIALKGRLVIDHFMGLRSANRTLHRMMAAYFCLLPLMVVVAYLFPEMLAKLTTP